MDVPQAAEPITHGGSDRGFKTCKCVQCGIIEQCTPSRDFYNTEPDGPLYCEDCFWAKMYKEHFHKE